MEYDAIVVGSGPNGLAAAVTCAQAGARVLVIEAKETLGGGARTLALTLPGFQHDVCSAVHPLGVASPWLRRQPLADFGLEWIFPPAALAHPLADGPAMRVERSFPATAATLGVDGGAYQRWMKPLAAAADNILEDILGPLPLPPRHLLDLIRFGSSAVWPARTLAERLFQGERARALFAGMAAHSMLPLEAPVTSAIGMVLGMLAHGRGWPVAKGGSQALMDALAAYLRSLGGAIITAQPVRSLADLPPARLIFLDVTPRQVLQMAGDLLPDGYRRALTHYRYGMGVCKVDYALSDPIPWKDPACLDAGTVHLGGTLPEIAAAERATWHGTHPENPFVLLAQPSLFDATRAPEGKHTAWAYCHTPHDSPLDMTERITAQIERFAPGFREVILASHTFTAQQMEVYNPNYIGGDINGGVQDWRQIFTRPVARLVPYATPRKGLYLCSSATPPGGGVHGMCGYHAARAALKTNWR